MIGHLFRRFRYAIFTPLFVLAVLGVDRGAVYAQGNLTGAQQELRQRIERRYEVLPLHNGILLKSRNERPVQSIELADNKIAVNGIEVTGPELRQQLGSDGDLVLQLSYLELSAQRQLFGLDSQRNTSPQAEPPRSPSDGSAQRRNRRSGALVRFGGDVTVGPDEVTTDDVVVFGGTAHIDGQVNGDVVVIGGRVELGPKAYVTREVTVIGGTLERDPGAVVDGDVNEVGVGPVLFDRSRFGRPAMFGSLWPATRLLSLAGTSMRAAVLILLGCIVILLARRPIERIGERAIAEPLKAGLVGLLAELLFLPTLIVTVVLLAISIVGIPLLLLVPFALLVVVVVLLMGFTAVTHRLGDRIAARFGWSPGSPYLSTVMGIVIILAPVLLARIAGVASGGLALVTIPLAVIGFLVEYVAWTVGLGAAALARFARAPTTMSAGTISAGT